MSKEIIVPTELAERFVNSHAGEAADLFYFLKSQLALRQQEEKVEPEEWKRRGKFWLQQNDVRFILNDECTVDDDTGIYYHELNHAPLSSNDFTGELNRIRTELARLTKLHPKD